MNYEFLEIFSIVTITAMSVYWLTRNLFHKEMEKKFQVNLLDINHELKDIKKLQNEMEYIPSQVGKDIDRAISEINGHTDTVGSKIQVSMLENFENNISQFECILSDYQQTAVFDEQMRESIDKLIQSKMDTIIDKVEALPHYEKKNLSQDFSKLTELMNKIAKMIATIQTSSNQDENMKILLTKLEKMGQIKTSPSNQDENMQILIEKFNELGQNSPGDIESSSLNKIMKRFDEIGHVIPYTNQEENMKTIIAKFDDIGQPSPNSNHKEHMNTIISKLNKMEKTKAINNVVTFPVKAKNITHQKTTKKKATKKSVAKPRVKAKKDDLTQINGIGKFVQRVLNRKFGIQYFTQLACLNAKQMRAIDQEIYFAGKPKREKWRAQANKIVNHKMKHMRKRAA